METTKNKVSYRLFCGFLITSELRMHLFKSQTWKEVKIIRGEDKKNAIEEAKFENKDYLGKYFEISQLPMKDLKRVEEEMYTALAYFCPSYRYEKSPLIFFSQAFIK